MIRSAHFTFTMFITGLVTAVIQCVLVREYLTVFAGNELVLGLVLAVWLVSTGAGSIFGSRAGRRNDTLWGLVLCFTAGYALTAVRVSRTFFAPGELVGPHAVAVILLCTETFPAFTGGWIFGTLSRDTNEGPKVYISENLGGVTGALLMYGCVMAGLPNSVVLACALCLLAGVLKGKSAYIFVPISVAALLLGFDRTTTNWKYSGEVAGIRYGREGELAVAVSGNDTTVFLNNIVYRSSLEKPLVEQSVHISMGQRPKAANVLVIYDKGYTGELKKYGPVRTDRIESEPIVASPGSQIVSPERFSSHRRYDIILLGLSLPDNAAAGRFFTVSSFTRLNSLLTGDGIVSFTLPFSENYMSASERKLYEIIRATLSSVFSNVLVFPGDGYTFLASQGRLDRSFPVTVATDYLEAYVIPSLSTARIEAANAVESKQVLVNTVQRPAALLLALQVWLSMFGQSFTAVAAAITLCAAAMIVFLPKSRAVLSVATTGFSTGVYSIALMLLYQAVYGTLYSQIAILLAALTAGFVLGGRMTRFGASDLVIGLYSVFTLCVLSALSQPHISLFFAAHAGMGFLSGAQFVTRKNVSLGPLNASDLVGGMFGMAITSTVLIPVFGLVPVATGIGGLKGIVFIFSECTGRKPE
jgi:spermidine synthase